MSDKPHHEEPPAMPTSAFKASFSRIGNATAHTLMAMSVSIQLIRYALALNGYDEHLHPALRTMLDNAGFVIAPAAALAFVKFLLCLIRGIRRPLKLFAAGGYLAILLLPLLLPAAAMIRWSQTRPEPAAHVEPRSEEFMNGYDWAKAHGPPRHSACPGSPEFIRGCYTYVVERREELMQAGSDWAAANRPAKPSACQGAPYFVLGCRRYFEKHLTQPKPPGQGRYEGMTTEECKAEVNAAFEAAERIDLEDGNPQSAAVTRRNSWLPALADCENYDKVAENKFMPAAYQRLEQLIDRLKAGATLSEEEKSTLLKDFSAMSRLRDQPYKTAYLERADEYFARLSGEYKEVREVYPRISCELYQAKLSELARLDRERVAAMRALRKDDRTITNGARYDALNQQRIDMLWEWKHFNDGAKANGCTIELPPDQP